MNFLVVVTPNSIYHEQNLSTGLWYIGLAYKAPVPIEPSLHSALFPGKPQANNVYELTKKWYIATYLHRACFSPVPSTWTAAIDDGLFSTWPGLTSQIVCQRLPKSVATAKGHLRTARSNQRSATKPNPIPSIVSPVPPPVATTTPFSPGLVQENECYL